MPRHRPCRFLLHKNARRDAPMGMPEIGRSLGREMPPPRAARERPRRQGIGSHHSGRGQVRQRVQPERRRQGTVDLRRPGHEPGGRNRRQAPALIGNPHPGTVAHASRPSTNRPRRDRPRSCGPAAGPRPPRGSPGRDAHGRIGRREHNQQRRPQRRERCRPAANPQLQSHCVRRCCVIMPPVSSAAGSPGHSANAPNPSDSPTPKYRPQVGHTAKQSPQAPT